MAKSLMGQELQKWMPDSDVPEAMLLDSGGSGQWDQFEAHARK